MWVDRSRLLNALLCVKPALGKQDGENLLHFAGGRVSANNGELCISASLPYRLVIQGAVPAKQAIRLIEKQEIKDIEIDYDLEHVYLRIGTMEVGIVSDARSFAIEGVSDPANLCWFELPKDFQEKLKFLFFSISDNSNHPILTCLHWQGHIIEACDNTRFTRCALSVSLPDGHDLLIPRETAAVLKNNDYDLTHFSVAGSWLYFKCSSGTVVSCRLYAAKFPPMEKILTLPYGKPFRLPADLADILKRLGDLAPKDDLAEPYILVAFDEGVLTVIINQENNLVRNRIINSNESIRFWINPNVLRDILGSRFDRVAVSEMLAGTAERFLKFDGDGFTHVIGVAPATHPSDVPSISPSQDSGAQELEPVAMYCAGTEGFELERNLLRSEMKNRLLSYAFVNHSMYDKYLTDPHRRNYQNIMFDSGAFSVWKRGSTINLDEYVEYCKSQIEKVSYVVSLDVIPGKFGAKNLRLMTKEIADSAVNGYANYRIMLRSGIPKDKLLHVFHQGEEFRVLQKMVEEVPYIGLSPGNDRSTGEKISWLMDCMRYVTDEDGRPKLKLHGFAVTSLRLVRLFPWTSIDSATWGISAGHGYIMIPTRRDGKWDFSSDAPLKVTCSHIKDSPDHIDNQPRIVQKTTINPYLESLGLTRGKSTYRVCKKSEKLPQEKEMSKNVGARVLWAQSSFEKTYGKNWKQLAAELADDEIIVETIDEAGVLNSLEVRHFLNVYYLNEFLKTLPKNRRFVRPENRVDLRWFLTGEYDGPEGDPAGIEEMIENKVVEILSRTTTKQSPPPSPAKKGERKRSASSTSRSSLTKSEPKSAPRQAKGEKAKKIPQKTVGKRKRVKDWDSVKKILFKYFAAVTKVRFTAMGRPREPKPLQVSHTLARGYECKAPCGACCHEYSLDYLPNEAPDDIKARFIKFDDRQVPVFSDVQKEKAGLNCRHLDEITGLCGIHKTHPLSCDFELIRCYMGKTKSSNRIGIGPYGRGHSYTRVDGGTGALCKIYTPDEDSVDEAIADTVKKLRRLEDWATHFGLVEHHIPEIIDFLETTKGRKGNKWLFPKDWTQEQCEEFRTKQKRKKKIKKG